MKRRSIVLLFLFLFILFISFFTPLSAISYTQMSNFYENLNMNYLHENSIIMTLESDYITSYVLTPNGTDVEVLQILDEFTPEQIEDHIDYYQFLSPYKDAELLSDPTKSYNCHSYAWYNQNTYENEVWMNTPMAYYTDYSYCEVSVPRKGDIICYFDECNPLSSEDDINLHSGIIDSINPTPVNDVCGISSLVNVISKWGAEGLFRHRGDICPYVETYGGDADYIKFYRPRTNNSFNITNDMNSLNVSRNINSNGTIVDKYGMYELNVDSESDYLINVQANNSLDIRLYNINMNLMEMTLINSNDNVYNYTKTLSEGTYYLRVAYSNLTNSGNILININPHTHDYSDYFEPLGIYTHRAYCDCGHFVIDSHNVSSGHCNYCGYTHTHEYSSWQYYNNRTHIEICDCGLTGIETRNHYILAPTTNLRVTCLGCRYLLNLSTDIAQIGPSSELVTKVTINGSYILPNGIVVLQEVDLESYENGTLVFYNKSDLPIIK